MAARARRPVKTPPRDVVQGRELTPLAREIADLAAVARHWLMKSEPEVFGIDDLERKKRSGWDGVRNHQAKSFMQKMRLGDKVLFYHSNAEPPGVAGLATVARLAHPDHTQFDPASQYYDPTADEAAPRWWMVEVAFAAKFKRFIGRDELLALPGWGDSLLVRQGRLSVLPLTKEQYAAVVAAAG